MQLDLRLRLICYVFLELLGKKVKTPSDFEDGLVEVRNRRLGSVILSYHQLVTLINQAEDGRHLTQLGNAEIRAAKKFRKLTRKDSSESLELL
jgi:hypothetical protein